MLAQRSVVVDVPSIAAVLFYDWEHNDYQRTFFLKNLTGLTLTYYLEESTDGGDTWSSIESASLTAGAGTFVNASDSNNGLLQLRASGGGEDADLEITMVSYHADTDPVRLGQPVA